MKAAVLTYRGLLQRSLLAAIFLGLYVGCQEQAVDDDDATAADDDISATDDDTTTEDSCADTPGQVICIEGVAIHCSEDGITENTEVCDQQCCEGLGCSSCCPGEMSCLDNDVVTCSEDGIQWQIMEVCDVDAGFACRDGACVELCQNPDEVNGNRGCVFYTMDLAHLCDYLLDSCYGVPVDSVIAVVNDGEIGSTVVVDEYQDGSWGTIRTSYVDGRSSQLIELPSKPPMWTGLYERFAFRLTSTAPVFAYQFQPTATISINEGMALIPASSNSTSYWVKDWCCLEDSNVEEYWELFRSMLAIVGTRDNTAVCVTPSVPTEDGDGVEAAEPGQTLEVTIQEGDVLQIRPAEFNTSLDSTLIESDAPVAVFVGHPAAYIPSLGIGSVGHIEEQLLGREVFGSDYVAARIYPRNDAPALPEDALWHVTAGDQAVELTFTGHNEVNGLPIGGHASLVPGETLELFTDGTVANPGDFHVSGSEWFVLTQYMTGNGSTLETEGDPCMVQTIPPERFRADYAVYALEGWNHHVLTITRQPDVPILLDGLDIETHWDFSLAGISAEFEVLRIEIEAGHHFLESTLPFGLVVVGEESSSPYCYFGGFR